MFNHGFPLSHLPLECLGGWEIAEVSRETLWWLLGPFMRADHHFCDTPFAERLPLGPFLAHSMLGHA